MISTEKQMIRIPTDPTNLSTDCIGISSRRHKRGRPKGSKSKTKTKRRRKRTATESNLNDITSSSSSTSPKRKKRKPNRSHREAFPNHTDEDIRRQLALERKAKNRKSAQESRERRKQQELYLNHRLPQGLALKRLLRSEIKTTESECIKHEKADDINELSHMKMILTQMVDNNAIEYDEYANIDQHKAAISDELIFTILSQYLHPSNSDNNDDDYDDLELETDNDTIHLCVIGEIENGIPMQMDDIPISATPMSFKATRGRKKQKKTYKNEVNVLKTPPSLPQIIGDNGIPPPVFGVESADFNIDSESAVSLYPLPRDTMLNQYHFQSVYSVGNPQYIIKHEKASMDQYHHHHHHHHPMTMPLYINTEQTPSTISSNSTISNAMMKEETEDEERGRGLMDSPLCIAPCIHTPEQMHFIQPLAQMPHSPIIRTTAAEDMEETRQMLMNNGANNMENGLNSKNGNSLKNINNGCGERRMGMEMGMEMESEMRILSILVQIVQSFVLIMCGMEMGHNIAMDMDTMKKEYLDKLNLAIEDLRILVMDFMRQRLDPMLSIKMWMNVQQDIVQIYIVQMMQMIKNHPLIQNTKTQMDMSFHYQIYRQIAMEILQNMKQQSTHYQMMTEQGKDDAILETRTATVPAPIPAFIPLQRVTEAKDVMTPLDLNQDYLAMEMGIDHHPLVLDQMICSEVQMNSMMDYHHSLHHQCMDPLTHLIKSKHILEEKCFNILLDKKS